MSRDLGAVRRPSKTAAFDAARTWDAASLRAVLASAPGLVGAVDCQGALALASGLCGSAGPSGLNEFDGTETVATLLKAGADLEQVAPMDKDEGDFRATPLWYAIARGENRSRSRGSCWRRARTQARHYGPWSGATTTRCAANS